MKNTIIHSFKQLVTNRYLTTLAIILTLLALGLIIYIAVAVRPSELQLVTHYTAFGVTHLYRDQWFYLLGFAVFAALVAFFHIALAIKLYVSRGHSLALLLLWMGIGIVAFAWITAIAILNVWSPL